VVFVAQATREAWNALDSNHNFTVIPNGLNPKTAERLLSGFTREEARDSLGLGTKEVAVVLLGTVCERKGQQDLALAVRELPQAILSRARFFIVGDRPSEYSAHLARLVAELPPAIRQRVAIVPETLEPGRYYRAADVFVCSSRIESYPRVVLEAMAAGLPLVTTPVFGIREQVQEGVNGLFYAPGQPAELARALAELIGDDVRRREMGVKSLDVLAGLTSFDEMVAAYAALFREAWATGNRPASPADEVVARTSRALDGDDPCAASPG
jgi:glycosyltransferase involved in cell wall biosynthesis